LRITGFGAIDITGNKLTYVSSGRIKTLDVELPLRLKSIMDNLN